MSGDWKLILSFLPSCSRRRAQVAKLEPEQAGQCELQTDYIVVNFGIFLIVISAQKSISLFWFLGGCLHEHVARIFWT